MKQTKQDWKSLCNSTIFSEITKPCQSINLRYFGNFQILCRHRYDLDKSDSNLYEADKMRLEEFMQFNEFFRNYKTLPINQSEIFGNF